MNHFFKNISDYVLFGILCLVYSFAFIFICSAYSGNNVLHLKSANKKTLSSVYPATLPYFNRDILSDKIYNVYQVNNNKAIPISCRPFAARFLLGLNLDFKIINDEVQYIVSGKTLAELPVKYTIDRKGEADINNYIRPDTLRYNSLATHNVQLLKGKILVAIESADSWQQARNMTSVKTVTIIPVNLNPAR